jgi:D-xylose transport system substrate-binding protein
LSGFTALTLIAAGASIAAAASRPKIGFLLKTMQEERYQTDKAAFIAKANELGADVVFDSANNDEQTQLSAFENMLSKGVKAVQKPPLLSRCEPSSADAEPSSELILPASAEAAG